MPFQHATQKVEKWLGMEKAILFFSPAWLVAMLAAIAIAKESTTNFFAMLFIPSPFAFQKEPHDILHINNATKQDAAILKA
jgi:hypothetical protein